MTHQRLRLLIASALFSLFGVCAAFSNRSNDVFTLIALVGLVAFIVEWARTFREKA